MKSIKKNKSPRSKRKLVIIVSAVLVVLAGGGALAYSTHSWPFDNNQSENSTDNTVDTKEEFNKTYTNTSDNESTVPPSSPTPAEDKSVQTGNPVDQTNPPEVPNITRAEQSGNSIRVSAIFNNASNGKCVLRLEKAGYASIVKEASIIIGPSYYVCNGFQIPRTELPTGGEWSVIVTHELGGKSSTSERKNLNVQ